MAVYNTGLGACLSIFVKLLTFAYLGNNLNAMFKYKGSNVNNSVADSFFTYNDAITQDDGFRIAVGIDPDAAGNKDTIARYLELTLKIKKFDFSKTPIYEETKTVELHTCSDNELSEFY